MTRLVEKQLFQGSYREINFQKDKTLNQLARCSVKKKAISLKIIRKMFKK